MVSAARLDTKFTYKQLLGMYHEASDSLVNMSLEIKAKDAEIERLQQEVKDLEARLDGDRYG